MTRIPPVRRLLMKAKALLSKPEKWCKGTSAKDKNGKVVSLYSSTACQFCPYGAIQCAAGVSQMNYSVFRVIEAVLPGKDLIDFNDAPSTTHPMIMRLFNKAIRRAKEQGI